MAPDPKYVPANMFVRRFQVDLMREERVLGAPVTRGTKVRGIYGERENDDDVPDVKTLVTTYTPEGEDDE